MVAADALILQFPLWWFGMPAILKGWIDRVFAYGLAYGYRGEGNRYRYGDGGLSGKRAILSVTVGDRITADRIAAAKEAWRIRLKGLFEEEPIPFRPQNGGDYPDGHVLASHIAMGETGLTAHVAKTRNAAGD
ncbi:NAD(P)H-dependent oxidoreductase [Alicyclobacillus sp. SO9]|uniref:NAD(P)H-dependent oxidoreductase n=1 Tax=Alicyclobacillus sp. SO9 TaxID=2665646 RepID=UPI002715307D|nr:NAD(P)H-dependent oxidoreductase [Alicyclobacillus sp. SO9]